ncbi:MAG: hypothetical protein FWC55_06180 [Firmicutes bacterium]|nr:hypothetical protein [Bacillota bacterium]
MHYNDMFWRIFEKSGSLDAYMGYIDAVSVNNRTKNEAAAGNHERH